MDLAILAAARFPISEPFAGGMEAHTHALAEGLTARGHRVTVLAAGGVGRFEVRPMVPVDFARVGAGAPRRRGPALGRRGRAPQRTSRPSSTSPPPSISSSTSTPSTICRSPASRACSDRRSRPPCTALRPHGWSRRCAWPASAPTPRRWRPCPATNAAAWSSIGIDRIIGNGIDLDTWVEGVGGGDAVWTGRVVPEKAPHLAIDAAGAPGCRCGSGPVRRPRVLRAGDRSATRPRRPVPRARNRRRSGGARPAQRRRRRHPDVGRAVRTRRRRGAGVRHARRGLPRGALADLVDDESGALAPAGDVAALSAASLRAPHSIAPPVGHVADGSLLVRR